MGRKGVNSFFVDVGGGGIPSVAVAAIEIKRLESGEVCRNPPRNERSVVSLKAIKLGFDAMVGLERIFSTARMDWTRASLSASGVVTGCWGWRVYLWRKGS